MASSQESRSIQTQLEGEISNKLGELLKYEEKYTWDSGTIEYPYKVTGGARNNFYENNSDRNFKAALVYKFKINNNVPQYWIFAWYSPKPELDSTNKVFTKLVYNKNDIDWDEIENELDKSTNKSANKRGPAMVLFTAPEDGISDFKATIEYAPIPK